MLEIAVLSVFQVLVLVALEHEWVDLQFSYDFTLFPQITVLKSWTL